jgi:flagellar hook-associated protein 2
MKTMVDNYNKFRAKLADLTAYDAVSEKPSVLTGDATALRLDTELSYLFSGRFMISNSPASMENFGIHLQEDGTLEFDEEKFSSKFAADPAGTEAFFTAEGSGFSDKFHELLEELAGEQNSLLSSRLAALDEKIIHNEERMASMDSRLIKEQNRLLLEFYRLESAIAKMQRDLGFLQSMQVIPPMTASSDSS